MNQKAIDESHIRNFRELFGVDEYIDDAVIARQKEVFGFSLFLLHSKSVYEALKIGFLNSRGVFLKSRVIFIIPHTYIFGGMLLGGILQLFDAIYLFLPIFFLLILWSIFPAFRMIRKKVELYKKSRIFFNVSRKQAETIKEEFMSLTKSTLKNITIQTKGGKSREINSFAPTLLIYLFGQPFIFGHLHLFAGVPISDLLIFDVALFFVVFGFFEKGLFFAFACFYTIYFYLFDKIPRLFSRKNQEYDLYTDIYKLGNTLLVSMDALKNNMEGTKKGIIDRDLGKNLSTTIRGIEKLYTLVEQKSYLFDDKEIFQKFLVGLLNEILVIYSQIFDFLANQILMIESNVEIIDLDETQKHYLLAIVKPILEHKKEQLQNMKDLILSKVVIRG